MAERIWSCSLSDGRSRIESPSGPYCAIDNKPIATTRVSLVRVVLDMEAAIAAWENEGGSQERAMRGRVNQIAWAEQLKAGVDEAFDRVRKALEAGAGQ